MNKNMAPNVDLKKWNMSMIVYEWLVKVPCLPSDVLNLSHGTWT